MNILFQIQCPTCAKKHDVSDELLSFVRTTVIFCECGHRVNVQYKKTTTEKETVFHYKTTDMTSFKTIQHFNFVSPAQPAKH